MPGDPPRGGGGDQGDHPGKRSPRPGSPKGNHAPAGKRSPRPGSPKGNHAPGPAVVSSKKPQKLQVFKNSTSSWWRPEPAAGTRRNVTAAHPLAANRPRTDSQRALQGERAAAHFVRPSPPPTRLHRHSPPRPLSLGPVRISSPILRRPCATHSRPTVFARSLPPRTLCAPPLYLPGYTPSRPPCAPSSTLRRPCATHSALLHPLCAQLLRR